MGRKLAYRRVYYDRGLDLDVLLLIFWDEEKGDWITEKYTSLSNEFDKLVMAEPDPEVKAKYDIIVNHTNDMIMKYGEILENLTYECPICKGRLRVVKAKWVKAKLNAWKDTVVWCPRCRITIVRSWVYDVLNIMIYKYERGFKFLVHFVRRYRMYDVPPHEELKYVINIYAKKDPLTEKIIGIIPEELRGNIRWE